MNDYSPGLKVVDQVLLIKKLNSEGSALVAQNPDSNEVFLYANANGELIKKDGTNTSSISENVEFKAGSLARTHDKLAQMRLGTVAQLRILVLGDSVSRAKPSYIAASLARAYGVLSGSNTNITVYGGATVTTGNYTIHPTGDLYSAGVAAGITVDEGGGYAPSDSATLFYVKEPGAGTFKIQADTGSGYADVITLDANAASVSIASYTIPSVSYVRGIRIKTVGLTGIVRFALGYFKTTTVSGVEIIHVNKGGTAITDQAIAGAATWGAIITSIRPDLVTWEGKETVIGMASALTSIRSAIATAAPLADFMWVGTTPNSEGTDPGGVDVQAQNALLKDHAKTYDDYYFDCYKLCRNAQLMADMGWLSDGVHPTNPCHSFCAQEILKDSGLEQAINENPYTNRVYTSKVVIQTAPNPAQPFTSTAGWTETDNFSLDVFHRINRSFFISTNGVSPTNYFGITLSGGNAGTGFLPSRMEVGSGSGVWLRSDGGSLVLQDTGTGGSPANLLTLFAKEIRCTFAASGSTIRGFRTLLSTPTIGSISANSELTITLAVPGAVLANRPVVNLGWVSALPTGIIVAQAWCSANDVISVRLANLTASPVTPGATVIRVGIMEYN